MRKVVIAVSLLILFAGAAVAQTTGSSKSKGDSSGQSAAGAGSAITAPVGHRQPRASDVPDEKNLNDPNDPLSKENRALDKKIKNICRGC